MTDWIKWKKHLEEELGNTDVRTLPPFTLELLQSAVERVTLEEKFEMERIREWRESNPEQAHRIDIQVEESVYGQLGEPELLKYPESKLALEEQTNVYECYKYLYLWITKNQTL